MNIRLKFRDYIEIACPTRHLIYTGCLAKLVCIETDRGEKRELKKPREGLSFVYQTVGHMEANPNPDLELVHAAIQMLLQDKKETKEEEKRKRQLQPSDDDDDDDDHLLLSKLLSQVESLKASRAIEKSEASADTGVAVDEVKAKSDAAIEAVKLEAKEENEGSETEATPEEIVRELKKVKRQNTVTHWLLSAMIALTIAWQLSEVSLILKVRDGLSHPFRSFGSTITGLFKGPAMEGKDNSDKDADQRQSETTGIPPLRMPQLLHFDVPDLIPNGGNHSPGSA